MTAKRLVVALSLMLLATAGIACAGSDEGASTAARGTDGGGDTMERGRVPAVESKEFAAYDSDTAAIGESTQTGAGGTVYDTSQPHSRDPGLPDIGPSVIKTATVELEVKDDELQETIQNATSTAEKYGGFVVSTSVTDDEEHPTGSIVVRIPATRFGDALGDLESLGNVNSESVSGQDVSQEFIDLEARLRNYIAQETVMLRLMESAQTVTDTIRVQNELQRVQLEIERLRGRLNYLEDQTAMSTIELRIVEEGAITEPPGEFEKAWERAKDALVAVTAGLISSLGVIVPLAVLAFLGVFVWGRVRPRFTNPS